MALSKDMKEKQIEEIIEKMSKSKGFVIVNYKGISVSDDTAMRKSCREAGVEYKVFKNRLVVKALQKVDAKDSAKFEPFLQESNAIAFANSDALAAAKVLAKASQSIKALQIKCGMMDNEFIDANTVNTLATIPSKEVLLGQLLGLLLSPMSSLARAINEVAQKNA